MRRMVGAAIVIVALGGGSVYSWWSTRGALVPADSSVTFVPSLPDSLEAPVADSTPAPRTAAIDYLPSPLAFLSTAPAESLDLLPGVGPVLATRLVAARRENGPFRSWDDVDQVRGIGKKTIQRLQTLSREPRR